MNKIALLTSLALIGLGLGACQSDANKVAQAENELKQAYAATTTNVQNPEDKQVQEYLESTPALYRVSWKVCGDDKLSVKLKLKINKGCNETRNEPTEGYTSPAYVWADAKEIKFVNKRHFVDNLQYTGLFVKSRGCLNLGTPQQEKFYKVEEFTLKKGNDPLPSNVKLELVSQQEKKQVLKEAIAQAKLENNSLTNFGVSSNGLIPIGKACPTIEEWQEEP
ncbi:hypothetical protein NSMS1_66090 (plasmid) [Nostoc sp. MS1]|nr:hypothetical protein NSMS1_66090 [Nostoc sp. MS1]